MIRSSAVAGQFYEDSPRKLAEELAASLKKAARKERVFGAVCPHAGYMYSGKVAGAVYSRIAPADTYVILGPDHHGIGSDFSVMTEGVWRTPLGEIRIDSALAKEIYKRSKHLEDDPFAQSREHSVEVQLPFIQYTAPRAEMVPISLRHYAADEAFLAICEDIGSAIGAAATSMKHKVTVIASSDFTHYQPRTRAKENDEAALQAIAALDAKGLFEKVRELDISMCGYAPVAAAITASKMLGAKKGEVVMYADSGDVTSDPSSVVGYAGVTFT